MGQIYKHISPSGKFYIGATRYTWEKRAGKSPLSEYRKSSPVFFNAIQKYGWENFTHEVLEDNIPDEMLFERERYWIEKLEAIGEKGYNCLRGGGTKKNDKNAILDMCGGAEGLRELYETRSTAEVGEMLGVHYKAIYGLLKEYDIPLHSANFRSEAYLAKRKAERKPIDKLIASAYQIFPHICEFCQNSFMSKRHNSRFCSRSCAGKYLHTLPNIKENIQKARAAKQHQTGAKGPQKGQIGNKGHLTTNHTRWHVRRANFIEDCEFCKIEPKENYILQEDPKDAGKPSREDLLRMYVEEGKTATRIGEEVGFSQKIITTLLKRYDIPIRPRNG